MNEITLETAEMVYRYLTIFSLTPWSPTRLQLIITSYILITPASSSH